MAKQTFTTGQILTAAQQNTLQTNDFNQTVSAKVASYVLVAADVGTRITMNNAAATTITVNTGLFAAGDTLSITNIGAGVCTITAGTATVSTAGVLTLAQNASGTLYFTSTGVSIFNGSIAGGSRSYSLLSTTATTTTSTTISGLGGYNSLYFMLAGVGANATGTIQFRLNADTTNNYNPYALNADQTGVGTVALSGYTGTVANRIIIGQTISTFPAGGFMIVEGANTTGIKMLEYGAGSSGTGSSSITGAGTYNGTSAISSATFLYGVGTVFVGSILTYGSVI